MPKLESLDIPNNPFTKSGSRPYTVYVGDTAFGDSGKGIIVATFNRLLSQKVGPVFSMRFNGGGNAGHHMWLDGVEFFANQLPTAIAEKGATAAITRGMVFNPRDAVMEIERARKTFGGKIPGNLIIDERVPLSTDLHRILDTAEGSTGRGIGPAYADFIGTRNELTLKDLYSANWESKFAGNYAEKMAIAEALLRVRLERLEENSDNESRKKAAKIRIKLSDMSEIQVARLDNSAIPIGNKDAYLDNLARTRADLEEFIVPNMKERITKAWVNKDIPFTFEEAQGPGLDPYFGLRPDVTSSRPNYRSVIDATYGVIDGADIGVKVGATKTVYMSSVGTRWLPGEMPEDMAGRYQQEFGERGKTTGRLRGIYYLNLPILKALKAYAGYDYLAATHLDAARADTPISVVVNHLNGDNYSTPYGFYQDKMDGLRPTFLTFKSWDGAKTKEAHSFSDLDPDCLDYLDYLGQELAPVLLAQTGGSVGDFLPNFRI